MSLLALLWIAPAPCAPVDADTRAERIRLGEELTRLARRNAWVGVDRTYRALVELRIALAPDDHLLGGRAALAMGDPLRALYRMRRVPPPFVDAPDKTRDQEALDEARSVLTSLEEGYGLVSIQVEQEAKRELLRVDDMPFDPTARATVERAVVQVGAQGSYRGLLPVGAYSLAGREVDVEPGQDWIVVRVP